MRQGGHVAACHTLLAISSISSLLAFCCPMLLILDATILQIQCLQSAGSGSRQRLCSSWQPLWLLYAALAAKHHAELAS